MFIELCVMNKSNNQGINYERKTYLYMLNGHLIDFPKLISSVCNGNGLKFYTIGTLCFVSFI